MNGRVQSLTVRTPEGVVFSTRLAGPVTRFLAWGVDILFLGVLTNAISFVGSLLGFISPDIATAVTILLFFALTLSYGIVLEWYWRGQTLGKKLLRLRVVDLEGMRLQFSQVVIRNLLRAVDSMPVLYVVGGVTCLISRHVQRLGDIAANTVVVRVPRIEAPDVGQLFAGKFNSLRQYPHLEARLRQRVTPAEAELALRALLRRDDLDPAPRVSLFADLARHFQELVPFPPEATDGITDEQYVRNVVDTLFRKRTAREPSVEAAPAPVPEPAT